MLIKCSCHTFYNADIKMPGFLTENLFSRRKSVIKSKIMLVGQFHKAMGGGGGGHRVNNNI